MEERGAGFPAPLYVLRSRYAVGICRNCGWRVVRIADVLLHSPTRAIRCLERRGDPLMLIGISEPA